MQSQEWISRLRQILTNEVKWILWIVVFVWGVAVPYFGIKQDIALIQSNHMAHIEGFSKDLVRLNEDVKELNNKQIDQNILIIELMKEITSR